MSNNQGIFAKWAMRYFEMGIPVIPLDGKAAFLKNWQAWCNRPQTAEEVEALIERYPNANIGSPLGLWALALDIDTDDPDVIAAAPPTPYRRIGKTGVVLFYRPDRTVASLGQADTPIELLNVGRQVVLVPSRHPEGPIYRWEGLEVDPTDLPPFPPDGLSRVIMVAREKGVVPKRKKRVQDGKDQAPLTDFGRNNTLTRHAYGKACDGKSIDEGAEELLEFDKREHTPPWFSDPTEPHKGRSPIGAARRMMERAIAAATKKGDIRPHVEVVINLTKSAPVSPYPAPRGMMKLFVDVCELRGKYNQSVLGLGGALSMMAALCSNRVVTTLGRYRVTPNLYTFNVATSGVGKETAQSLLADILQPYNLLGASAYKSGGAIVDTLPERPVRLDIMDECAAFIRTLSSPEDYKSEIVDILSSLFSKAGGYYSGISSQGRGANKGACWHPHVSILGSTTPEGFKGSVTVHMAAKGLIPRFLLFYSKDRGALKQPPDMEVVNSATQELTRIVRRFTEQYRMERESGIDLEQGEPFIHEVIPATPAAQRLHREIDEELDRLTAPEEMSELSRSFHARFLEIASKLALLDAMSQWQCEVHADNLQWGYNVVKACWEASQPLYGEALARNDHERDARAIEMFIYARRQVTQGDLYEQTRHLRKFERDSILNSLMDAGIVIKAQSKVGTCRPRSVYVHRDFV